MQFIKTRSVKSPERKVNENAGIDCYVPNNTPEFARDLATKNPGIMLIDNTTDMNTLIAIAADKLTMFNVDNGTLFIAPHKDVIIPSGIRSKFEPNLALIANNKSGIVTKKKLVFGASVIDASYQGEWHFHMISTSSKYQTIECGQKIIQFIPHVISTDEVEVLDLTPEEFYTEKTSRGEGWQGSTGVK